MAKSRRNRHTQGIAHRAINAAEEILGPPLDRGQADDPALLGDWGMVTFGQLAAAVDSFGNACLAIGLERGQRVLFLVLDKPQLVAGYLGVMKAGGVAIAFNVRASVEDLAHVLDDSGCVLLVLDRQFLTLYRAAQQRAGNRPRLVVIDGDGREGADAISFATFVADHKEPLPAADTTAGEAAFWMYTSGTTGGPKGVVHAHGSVRGGDVYLSQLFGIGPGSRVFCTSKLFFAFALGHCLFASLRLGAAIVLFDGWPDAEKVIAQVIRHRPTFLLCVPTLYSHLLEAGLDPAFLAIDGYLSAGEKLPETLQARWLAAAGQPIYEAIGATETVFLFLANSPRAMRMGTCGRPTPGTRVRLRDDAGHIVSAAHVPGHLEVQLASLALEYWQLPEKTAAALIDGWYRSGDMFLRDEDGFYHFQGRSDDMLKISGQWVSPVEIENLALSHPGVADAAVVGVPNAEGLVRLTLFLVAEPTEEDLPQLTNQVQDILKAQLSIYKCPRRVLFLSQLPRTTTGKIQRFLLRRQAIDLGDEQG